VRNSGSRALIVLSALGLVSACASQYSYQTGARLECGANLAIAGYTLDYASNVERQTGQDVDAYGNADKFALWSNLFLTGFNALSSGRAPNADDACGAVNQTANFVYGWDD